MSGHSGAFPARTCQQFGSTSAAIMTDSEMRIKRAIYRANHRGTKELDILLGRFADAEASGMNPAELAAFEELLALPDPQIDGWIKGASVPPGIEAIVGRIRHHHGL
jgi:antitoxin CptB